MSEKGMTAGDQAGEALSSADAFLAAQIEQGCEVRTLPPGVERFVTVSATAIIENRDRESRNARYRESRKLLPTIVVRERRKDGTLQMVGVFRHAEIEGASRMEWLPTTDRFMKTNNQMAVVATRTTSPIRVYTHPADEVLSGHEDWVRIGC